MWGAEFRDGHAAPWAILEGAGSCRAEDRAKSMDSGAAVTTS